MAESESGQKVLLRKQNGQTFRCDVYVDKSLLVRAIMTVMKKKKKLALDYWFYQPLDLCSDVLTKNEPTV